jgi:FhuF 2Fe-2S C-terminal domain
VDVRTVLADVAGLGPFFTIGTQSVTAEPGWRPVAELYRDPRPLRDRIAQVRRALDSDDRVAASITFQGLAALLVSAPFAAVVLHGVLPGLTARALHWRPTEGGPWALRCPEPTGTPVAGADEGAAALVELLVAEHLAPLVGAVRAQVPVAERLLWGSVASAVASGKRLLSSGRPAAAGRAAAVAERVLAAGPLAGTGRLLPPREPDRDWTFRRRSCCLYYRVPGGGLCGDCVLLDRRMPGPGGPGRVSRGSRPRS